VILKSGYWLSNLVEIRLFFYLDTGIVRSMYCLILVFSLLFALPAGASPRVAVVQSGDFAAYREPVPAFLETVDEPTQVVVIRGRQQDAEELIERLARTNPIVVFCLGAKAAWTVRRLMPNTPMVYAAVNEVERYGVEASIVTGVRNHVAPVTYLSQFLGFFPDVRNVGILRGPSVSEQRIEELLAAANEVGVTITTVDVPTSRAVRKSFVAMAPNVDAVWLQPDRDILTRESYRLLTEEARRLRVPVMVDTYNMVRAGGLFAVVPDSDGIGVLAAEMVRDILGGKSPSEIEVRDPRNLSVVVNMRTVQSSQIPFDTLLLDFVDVVVE
jgi:putative ABC transport system substrate-binding protein